MSLEPSSTRERVLRAAATLLESDGRDALSTRSVASAAGVQVPAIYRHFGDKQGLLDALAAYGVAAYMADKQSLAGTADPLRLLREGWELHIAFGLTKPAFYLLVYGTPGTEAARGANVHLRAAFARLAESGRLAVSVDRATHLMSAAGVGVVLTLLGQPADERDTGLAQLACDLVLSAVTIDAAEPSAAPAAGIASSLATLGHALHADADADEAVLRLTAPERALMAQWVERMQRD